MIDADRSEDYVSDSDAGTPSVDSRDDYGEYLADMILEMQRMAAKSGRVDVAKRLLEAYKVARGPECSSK